MHWRDRLNGMQLHHPGAEAWLDVLLPMAVLAVGVQRGADPPALVLTLSLWLLLKVLLRAVAHPIFWVLFGVVLACQATWLQQHAAVSSPTDLLLFLAAFAVGMGRSRSQWRVSLWMLSAMVLASLFAYQLRPDANGNLAMIPWGMLPVGLVDQVGRIGGIAVNRSAYLFDLMALSAWSLYRFAPRNGWRRLAAAMAALAYALAFMTGSRAGAGLPLLLVLLLEICWRCRVRWSAMAMPMALAITLLLGGLSTLFYLPGSPLAYRTINDAGRADVAHCFLHQSLQSPEIFWFGSGGDRVSQICKRATQNPRVVPSGLRHAHNTFIQVLADHGAVALMALLALLVLSLRQALSLMASGDGELGAFALAAVLLFVAFSLVESVLLHVSLVQVLAGYTLAAAWPKGASGAIRP